MLEAHSLDLVLGGRPVLRGVSASFDAGRVSVILGPNGAGKSSLLACLAGLLGPASGIVRLDGQKVLGMHPGARARAIGLLPQRAEIHWDLDVATLVGLGRLPHASTRAEDEAAIAAALAATDTAHFGSRPVLSLSGGEQARVLLARVLAGSPRWLLADEPLANLDPAFQLDMLERLRATASAGAGVILVLHDLTQAARIADAALLLKEGAIVAAGAADEVLTPQALGETFGVAIHRGIAPDGTPLLTATARTPPPAGGQAQL